MELKPITITSCALLSMLVSSAKIHWRSCAIHTRQLQSLSSRNCCAHFLQNHSLQSGPIIEVCESDCIRYIAPLESREEFFVPEVSRGEEGESKKGQ